MNDNKVPLVVLIPVVVVAIGAAWFVTQSGKGDAGLEVGDCFIADTLRTGVTEDVETTACTEPHNAEVIEVFDSTRSSPSSSTEDCGDGIDPSAIDLTVTPEDTIIGGFTPSNRDWDGGDRRIVCWIFSETGFTARAVARS